MAGLIARMITHEGNFGEKVHWNLGNWMTRRKLGGNNRTFPGKMGWDWT
jgi:hypothetical protein